MDDSPPVSRAALPLALLAFLLVGWLTPPDPFGQLRRIVGAAVAAVASWFANGGADAVGASVRDRWPFALAFVGLLVASVAVRSTTLPPARRGLLAAAAAVVAGWVAFVPGAARLRRRACRW